MAEEVSNRMRCGSRCRDAFLNSQSSILNPLASDAMIGYLEGTLSSSTPPARSSLAGGVGYEVHISLSTYYRLEGKREVALEIYTHVREDALALYGFASADEKYGVREADLDLRHRADAGAEDPLRHRRERSRRRHRPQRRAQALVHPRRRQENRGAHLPRAPRQARRDAARRRTAAPPASPSTTTSSPPWSTSATARKTPRSRSRKRGRSWAARRSSRPC